MSLHLNVIGLFSLCISRCCRVNRFALLKLKEADIDIHFTVGCLVILFVFITPSLWSHALFNILGIKVFSYSVLYDFDFITKQTELSIFTSDHSFIFTAEKQKWGEPQLFQSWNRKQSLAIFQTGWSLLGEAWAVKRKFWLKKRGLFPSNFTVPPVTTSSVVWPWVACSESEEKVNWYSIIILYTEHHFNIWDLTNIVSHRNHHEWLTANAPDHTFTVETHLVNHQWHFLSCHLPWTGWQSSVWTWNSLEGNASKNSPRESCPDTALPFHTRVALSR